MHPVSYSPNRHCNAPILRNKIFEKQNCPGMAKPSNGGYGRHSQKPGLKLKEYYEIVGESRPLSAFFQTHADFFTEMHFYPD